jgi:hypothetical protein
MRDGIRIFALIALTSPSAGGCATHADRASQKVDLDTWRSPHPQSVDVTNTVTARQGRPPIALLVQSPAIARVMDTTSGRQVAAAAVAQGDIVSVDAYQGVHIAGQSLTGPLPGDHEYSIHLDFQDVESHVGPRSGK